MKNKKIEEIKIEKHKFLLVIEKELWEKFLETVPPYYDATKAITHMIRERVEFLNLDGEKQ